MNCKRVADYIVAWLKDYAKNAGVQGFVVGVSGGVDSGVVSTLCALTELPVYAATLPINTLHDNAVDQMEYLFKTFPNVRPEEMWLDESFEGMADLIVDSTGLALANLQSRIRMACLYFIANNENCIVVGTGNKVEDFGIGFFTKYGDGGVDISPIGDLTKSEVRELAVYLGIPECVAKAIPTDGLWEDNRTDESQIGASYEELEWAMTMFEQAKVPDSANWTDRQVEVYKIFMKRHYASRHKMEMPPICNVGELK